MGWCRDGAMGLTLDPQLIRDLTVLITSSTIGGMLMEAVRQPIINGFFIAGSIVGPGGLKLIKVLQCMPRCLKSQPLHPQHSCHLQVAVSHAKERLNGRCGGNELKTCAGMG